MQVPLREVIPLPFDLRGIPAAKPQYRRPSTGFCQQLALGESATYMSFVSKEQSRRDTLQQLAEKPEFDRTSCAAC
jgi:hypothetical protein